MFEVQTHDQGWKFTHRFSERIARFLRKKERMSDLLKKPEPFAHSLIFVERPERSVHIAHF